MEGAAPVIGRRQHRPGTRTIVPRWSLARLEGGCRAWGLSAGGGGALL